MIDLAGTFLDLAGINPPENMTAVSLMPLMAHETDSKADHRYRRDVSFSGLANFRVVVEFINATQCVLSFGFVLCCPDFGVCWIQTMCTCVHA